MTEEEFSKMQDANTELKIQKLSRAADWRAALMILTSDAFATDGRVWQHVDLDKQSIYFSKMLTDGTFSGGEQRLLQIAASLFSQQHQINLWTALGYLDENNAAIALAAMHTFIEGEK